MCFGRRHLNQYPGRLVGRSPCRARDQGLLPKKLRCSGGHRSGAGPELMSRCTSAAEESRATLPSVPCAPGAHKPHPPLPS
jgi:hypothetical protein